MIAPAVEQEITLHAPSRLQTLNTMIAAVVGGNNGFFNRLRKRTSVRKHRRSVIAQKKGHVADLTMGVGKTQDIGA